MRRGLLAIVLLMFVLLPASLAGVLNLTTPQWQPLSISLTSVTPSPSISPKPPTPSNPTNKNQAAKGIDTTIIVALIGLAGTLILVGFYIYQHRSNVPLELAKQAAEHQHDTAKQKAEFAHEEAMLRIEKEIEAEFEARKLKQQSQQTEDNIPPEREKRYQDKLLSDSALVAVQTPEMSSTLELEKIYTPILVTPNASLPFDLDSAWLTAQEQHDPGQVFRVHQNSLALRLTFAKTLDEVICAPYLRCILLSEIGAGKTTGLKHLALKAVQGELKFTQGTQSYLLNLPIYVELASFSSTRKPDENDIVDFAIDQWAQRYRYSRDEVQAYVNKKLEAGQAILLLDALDATMQGGSEEEATRAYTSVIQAINLLPTRYDKTSIVVTARKSTYERLKTLGYSLAGFTEWEVLDRHPDSVTSFITNWFRASNTRSVRSISSESLSTHITCDIRLQTLATNPLLLSQIITTSKQLSSFRNRVQLYERCATILLGRWDTLRGIARYHFVKPEEKHELLAKIAWEFHVRGKCYFPKDELLQKIKDYFQGITSLQAEQILQEIVGETGLLKQQTQGTYENYGFLCFALQEYFAAFYATKYKQIDTLLNNYNHPWWEEVILLYASIGDPHDVDSLLKKLCGEEANSLQDDIFYSNLILAGRCLAASPNPQRADSRRIILGRLLETLMQSSDAFIQERIARTLVEIGEKTVHEELRALPSNHQIDAAMRVHIAALMDLTYYSVPPELLPLLFNEQIELNIRKRILALNSLKEGALASELRNLLTDENIDRYQRMYIANILATLAKKPLASQLLELLTDEQILVEVRCGIGRGLGTRGDRSFTGRLLEKLEGQTHSQISWCIITTLGALGNLSVVPKLLELQKQQTHPRVQWGIILALNTLGALQEPSEALQIQQLLSKSGSTDDVYLNDTIYALFGIQRKATIALKFVNMLSSKHVDIDTRINIVDTLGYLADEEAIITALTKRWQEADIRDVVLRTTWIASHRIGVIVRKSITGDDLEIVKRQGGPEWYPDIS